jgi:hypothetical protein
MFKGKERMNVKTCYEFANDSMKICFQHNKKRSLTIKLKLLELCKFMFLSHKF